MSEATHHESSSTGRPRPDDSPPRNGVILVATIAAVATLFGLKFGFDSLFDASRQHVRSAHIAESHASEALSQYRTHSLEQLEGGQMTIEAAMSQLAERGRGAFVQIRPVADTSTAAREGWRLLPITAGEPAPRQFVAPSPVEPTPAVPADAPAEAPVTP
jgi:hypothetical protein